ncbi:MAG: phosphate ABC transporter permease PstA [Erysipelotrichaceae bacterium]|nr:phosphate ABC transporter permease PstA [Erysipelotrichaceae bacterium]
MKNQNTFELIAKIAIRVAVVITLGVLIFLVGFILVKGLPYIKPSMFSFTYNSDNVSLMPALISTIIITLFSLLISVPLGVFSAIYLSEYAKKNNKLVLLIRVTTETLSGIPSIVYGLFGMLFFVTFLGWGYSFLAGTFTLAIMILPLIIRTSEEALKAVSDTYREGSFGLGAGKLRTVFKIVVPSAIPGILSGIILAVGRIVGETAAVIYTSGTVAQIPTNLLMSVRTLSVHMYALSSEGLHMNEGYATAIVLLIVVVLINMLSSRIAKKIGGSL